MNRLQARRFGSKDVFEEIVEEDDRFRRDAQLLADVVECGPVRLAPPHFLRRQDAIEALCSGRKPACPDGCMRRIGVRERMTRDLRSHCLKHGQCLGDLTDVYRVPAIGYVAMVVLNLKHGSEMVEVLRQSNLAPLMALI